MKVTSRTEKVIAVELGEREATVLCALVGGVQIGERSEASGVVYELFSRLTDLLPGREETFSDFFTGKIEVLP